MSPLGAPTLEARWRWDPDGHDVLLGDVDHLPSQTHPSRVRLTKAPSPGSGEGTTPLVPRPGATGDRPTPGRRAARTLVLEGVVEAIDAAALRDRVAALVAAFADVRTERVLRIEHHPAHPRAGERWEIRCRGTLVPEDAPGPIRSPAGPYRCTFVLSLVAADPRTFGPERTVTVVQPDVPDPDPPLRLTFRLDPGVRLPRARSQMPPPSGMTSTVPVDSLVATPARLRIVGPVTRPVIRDVGRDVVLDLDVDVPAGSVLTVDPPAASVDLDGDPLPPDAVRWPESTWWEVAHHDVDPGPLTLALEADLFEEPTRVDVLYRGAQ